MYNLISLKTIIAKIYSDLGLGEEQVPVSDMIEWAAEALDGIEAPGAYAQKITGKAGIPLKKISGYQAQLPLDCKQVIQVAYATGEDSEYFYPMKYAGGSFTGNYGLTKDIKQEHLGDTNLDTVATSDLVDLTMRLYDDTYAEAVERLNTDEETYSILTSLLNVDKGVISDDGGTVNTDLLEYKIVPGYIKTNVKSGYLMISYLALPLDYYGYPMIPDHRSFIDAIFWYIAMKLSFIKWRSEPNQSNYNVYQHDLSKWNYHVKQAYGKAIGPKSIDEIESLKNNWLRLIPKINEGERFLKNINQQQQLRNFSY